MSKRDHADGMTLGWCRNAGDRNIDIPSCQFENVMLPGKFIKLNEERLQQRENLWWLALAAPGSEALYRKGKKCVR